MSGQWWYANGDAREGPVDLEVLADRVALAQLSPDTLVWREGLSGWQSVLDTPELAEHIPEPPVAIRKASEPPHERPVAAASTPSKSAQSTLVLEDASFIQRAGARLIDLVLGMAAGAFFLIVVITALRIGGWESWAAKVESNASWLFPLSFVFMMSGIAVEANKKYGTTFGKLCFGIRVVGPLGEHPTLEARVMREWSAFFLGFGAGAPYVSIGLAVVASARILMGKPPFYENKGARVVDAEPARFMPLLESIGRVLGGVLLIVVTVWVLKEFL